MLYLCWRCSELCRQPSAQASPGATQTAQGRGEEGFSQLEPGLGVLLQVESLGETAGRLEPLSKHQETFGQGRANESHLHSFLANKSPVKLFFLLVRRSSQGRYIFMGIYSFLPPRETSPFPLIKSGVIFTTKHLTSSHLAKNTPVRHGLGRTCKPRRA